MERLHFDTLFILFGCNMPPKRAPRIRFPEHAGTVCDFGQKNVCFPEHIGTVRFCKSLINNVLQVASVRFKFFGGRIRFPEHVGTIFYEFFSPLLYIINKVKEMAGKLIDMSIIKQVVLLHENGLSVRKIAEAVGISKNTVTKYLSLAKQENWNSKNLRKLEDPELEKKITPGNPAYTDNRMDTFLKELPLFEKELSRKHVTRYILWQEYKKRHHDGYSMSQFYFHLKQNLVAKPKGTAVLTKTYKPGNMLYVDFAGDCLSYIEEDLEEGKRKWKEIQVQTFVATLPYSDYVFVYCVHSQKVEDFLYALARCFEYLGGVPNIVITDNLNIKTFGYSNIYKPFKYINLLAQQTDIQENSR